MTACTPQRNSSVHFNFRHASAALALIAAVLLFCFSASAQLNYGRIFGSVTDQSGGTVIGATVTVTDVERGVSRTLTTDSGGQYSAPSLIPGTYTVRAEFKGFQTVERKDVVLGVGQDVSVDISLQPGEQTQTVTVTGEPPELNTTNAQLGGALENHTIEDLPVNGRQYTQLLTYRPGMQAKPGGGPLGYSANGARTSQQVWMFDGLFSSNIYSGGNPIIAGAGGGGGNDQSTILPLDAIQEINVIANPKAEYGWKPGAQVNVGLKSGTNSIHGSGYGFGRTTALTARNPFVNTRADQVLKQFGGVIGGPIKKDKLFYFGAYEGNRYLIGVPRQQPIPSDVAGAGAANSFVDAIVGLQNHTIVPNQLSLNLAGCTAAPVACSPGAGVFPANTTLSSNIPNTQNTQGGSDNALGKIDYHLNDHNSLNFEYFYGDGNFLTPGAQGGGFSAIQPYWRSALHARAQVLRGVWVDTPNSNWVNEFRFGYDNTTLPSSVGECVQDLGAPNYAAKFGFISGAQYCGFPAINITGFTQLGANSQFLISHWGATMASDSISWTHGNHLFKFGGEFHSTNWGGGSFTNGKGVINFTTGQATFTGETALEVFLAGRPNTGTLLIGSPERQLHWNAGAVFVQDDWRLTRRLTVNLGLRYEFETPVIEADDLVGNFAPGTATGMVQQQNKKGVFNGDYDNFGPRLGIAWDVTGKGTTVVRGGGSIVFTSNDLLSLISSPQGAQLPAIVTGSTLYNLNGAKLPVTGNINLAQLSLTPTQLPWTAGTPVFNGGTFQCGDGVAPVAPVAAGAPATLPPPCNISAINPNFQLGYVSTWTVGVQHAFTSGLTLSTDYVGTHGTKLPTTININMPTPGVKTSEQQRRPYINTYPWFANINYYTAADMSNYNALQVALVQRFSRGLSFTAGYTYAHALDEATANGNGPYTLNPRADYGDADFDARHRFTFATTYALPGIKSKLQMLEGWQLSSTLTLLGRLPYNAVDTSSDFSGTNGGSTGATTPSDRWDLVGSGRNFDSTKQTAPLPCYGVAAATGTGAFGGGTFVGSSNCIKVAAGATGPLTAANAAAMVANMPASCISAAQSLPTNPAVPLTTADATGLMSLASFGCYAEGGSAIVPPAQGTFGTMTRNALRGPTFQEWDLTLMKTWKFTERYSAQFRTEIYNVLNNTSYGTPTANPAAPASFGASQSSPNSSNSLIGSGGARVFQFGLKFLF